jgi:hypothetical protein
MDRFGIGPAIASARLFEEFTRLDVNAIRFITGH